MNISKSKSRFSSLAIAGRCKVLLVDPPIAKSTITAFSNASIVIILDGVNCCCNSVMICLPDSFAIRYFILETAGAVEAFGKVIPIASIRHCIVLAVPIISQAP